MPRYKITVKRWHQPDEVRTLTAGHESEALAEATAGGGNSAVVQQVDKRGRAVGGSHTYHNR